MSSENSNLTIVLLAIIALLALSWPLRHLPATIVAGTKAPGPLSEVKTWHYQLDHIDVARLSAVPADLMVIDFAKEKGKVPLTREEVARIKAGPDGRGRYVVAYISIGEAEKFRSYFRPEWKTEPPDWLGEENCAWPDAHRVRFWKDGWKNINYRAPDSYLRRIIEAGFDGIYLDRVDIYETFENTRPSAHKEMVQYVTELARAAWQLKPGFFIIPQNAEALLSDPDYRATIDAIGKESLLHGLAGTAVRNTKSEIGWSQGLLNTLRRDGKPVFAVEYLLDSGHISYTNRELRAYRFIPTFQTRALDGGDPTAPIKLNSEVGTPERTAKECPAGTFW